MLSFAATLCRGPRSSLCSLQDLSVAFSHALLDADMCVETRESTVWKSASRAAVPGVCDASHGEDGVHTSA